MNETTSIRRSEDIKGYGTRRWDQLTDYDQSRRDGMEENLADYYLKRNEFGKPRTSAAATQSIKQ